MRAINRPLLSALLLAISLPLILLLALATTSASRAETEQGWQAKVDPAVLTRTTTATESEFLLFLEEQADLTPAAAMATKAEKGAFVYEQLTRTAQRSQASLLRALSAAGADYRPYWIANMIWVRGDEQLIRELARRPDVAYLYANPRVRMPEPTERAGVPRQPDGIEWGINLVNAPEVWATGIKGEGIIIGGQDTGYQWDHPALKKQYRGWDGQEVDHNYNWHDAIHPDSDTGGVSGCGVELVEPCDDNGHGTHTMGTMVGDDGGGNQIGMAPAARWIGCRNMEGGWGTPATYSECFQWFVAPTDLSGQNPSPNLAPHVINNSWSCPPSEGCTDPEMLRTVVENVRAAGIVVVVSAGNSGPSCGTVSTPAAIYDASFSVGATTRSDNIASFSSRGPVTVDGSNRLKPDISAPGDDIRSSYPDDSYALLSGTSMAGPHVAGQVALLLAASPSLIGEVDAVEALIEQTALPLPTSEGCGGDSSSQIPNHTFGHGRIDAWAAVNAPALLIRKTTPATAVTDGDLLTYTLIITNAHSSKPTTNVVLTDVLPSGTTFFTATQPFDLSARTLRWYTATLPANSHWQVELVVQVSASDAATDNDEVSRLAGNVLSKQNSAVAVLNTITNERYGVRSDETVSRGRPVTTQLLPALPFSVLLPTVR